MSSSSEAIEYAFALVCSEDRRTNGSVITSPVHNVGDLALQLQFLPSAFVGYSTEDSIKVLCAPLSAGTFSKQTHSEAAFSKKVFLEIEVTLHHPNDNKLSKTLVFDVGYAYIGHAKLSLGACWLAAEVDGWFDRGDDLLVTVRIRDNDMIASQFDIEANSDSLLASMWRDMSFADYRIVAKGTEIACHRSVLAAASSVLQAMLGSDMEEGRQPYASIDELPSDISAMLEFIYTGQLPGSIDCLSIVRLLRIADCYALPTLFQVCKSLLLPKVTQDNIHDVLKHLALLESIPDCIVLYGFLLQKISKDFHLLESIAKQMVQTQLENEAVLRYEPIAYKPLTGILDQGTQYDQEDASQGIEHNELDRAPVDDSNAYAYRPREQAENSHLPKISDPTAPPNPLRSISLEETTFSPNALLRMRKIPVLEEPENQIQRCLPATRLSAEITSQETSGSHGPRRKTRRGRHNRSEVTNDGDRPWDAQYAPSFATHDSWH